MGLRRWSLPIWLAVFALLFFPLAHGQDALPAWNAASDKAWWDANPTPASWPGVADKLQAQLEANYKKNGPSCFSDADFQGWMEHLEWVRLGLASPDLLSKPDNLATFIALGEDETLSHLLVEKMVAKNVKTQALQNLIRLAQAGMSDLHEYAALGVAYSLVFDEPFRRTGRTRRFRKGAVPIGDLDIIKRFQFYVQANRDKKLDVDLTQLREEDLKYLVDSEVQLSELAYAQDEAEKIPYDHFEDAFFSIRYNESRCELGEPGFHLELSHLQTQRYRDARGDLRGPGLLRVSARQRARHPDHLFSLDRESAAATRGSATCRARASGNSIAGATPARIIRRVTRSIRRRGRRSMTARCNRLAKNGDSDPRNTGRPRRP